MAKTAKKKAERKKFITPPFRVSFPKLFEASAMDEDDPKAVKKFSTGGIWTLAKFTHRDKTRWGEMLKEMERLVQLEFGMSWKELDSKNRGIRDGKVKAGLEGYGEGTRFANMSSLNRPGVVDVDKDVKISPEEGNADAIYPGCVCRATITFFTYDKKGNQGIALGLRNLQKVADGPRLDNRVAAEDDFDEDIEEGWLDAADGDDDDGGDDFG